MFTIYGYYYVILEKEDAYYLVPPERFELPSIAFEAQHSSAELRGHSLPGRIRTCILLVRSELHRSVVLLGDVYGLTSLIQSMYIIGLV